MILQLLLRGLACPLLLLSISSGCSQQEGATKYPVTGTVLVNSSPVEGAVVYLHAVGDSLDGKDRTPTAVTDAKGEFHLSTSGKNDGAPSGEFVVTLRWPLHPFMTDSDRLRGEYASVASSDLRVSIDQGTTQLDPFRIEVPSKWLSDDLSKEDAN